MHTFNAIIEKYNQNGEKSNWFYIVLPTTIMSELLLQKKPPIRVKGFVDDVAIQQISLWPIGNAEYILPLNLSIRNKLKKTVDDTISIKIQLDTSALLKSQELLDSLEMEPIEFERFNQLTTSWQNNFHRMVNDGKSIATKTKRITRIIYCLCAGDTHEKMMDAYRSWKEN